jgi:hypothetical protein
MVGAEWVRLHLHRFLRGGPSHWLQTVGEPVRRSLAAGATLLGILFVALLASQRYPETSTAEPDPPPIAENVPPGTEDLAEAELQPESAEVQLEQTPESQLTPEEIAKALRRRTLDENEKWVKRVAREYEPATAADMLLSRLEQMEEGWEREYMVGNVGRALAGLWGDEPADWLAAQTLMNEADNFAVQSAVLVAFTAGLGTNAPYEFIPICEDVTAQAVRYEDKLFRTQAMEQLGLLGDSTNVLYLAEIALESDQFSVAIHGFDRLSETEANLTRLGDLPLPKIHDNLLRDGNGGFHEYRDRAKNMLLTAFERNIRSVEEFDALQVVEAVERLGDASDVEYAKSLIRRYRPDIAIR